MNTSDIEDVLMEITMDVDNTLADLCTKHKLDPGTLSTIVFARLTRMNFEMGNPKGFIDLARRCLDDSELILAKSESEHVH